MNIIRLSHVYIPWSSNGPGFGGLCKGPESVDRDLKAGEGTFDPLGGLAVGRFSRDVNVRMQYCNGNASFAPSEVSEVIVCWQYVRS